MSLRLLGRPFPPIGRLVPGSDGDQGDLRWGRVIRGEPAGRSDRKLRHFSPVRPVSGNRRQPVSDRDSCVAVRVTFSLPRAALSYSASQAHWRCVTPAVARGASV